MKHPLPLIPITFVVLFLVSNMCLSQSVGVVAYKETTAYNQEYSKVLKTSDGGILAIGVLGQSGRITKFNSVYTELWSFGIDSLPLTDAVETNDGNYVILGLSTHTNFSGAPYVIKMTPAGTLLFEKLFYTSIVSNQFTASGICKAAGTDNGFVIFGGNCAAMDYMIKFDASGNMQWDKQYSGTGNGFIASIIPETNGYVMDFNCSQAGVPSVGIFTADISGNVGWCKVMQSTNSVALFQHCLVKKNNGDYYLMTSPNDVYGAQNYTVSSTGSSITCMRYVNAGVQIEMTSVIATGNANDDILISGVLSPGYGTYLKINSSFAIVYQKQSTTFTSYFLDAIPLNNSTYLLAGSASSYGKILAVVDENANGVCSTIDLNLSASSYSFNTASPALTSFPVNAKDTIINYDLYSITQPRTFLCGSLSTEEISNSKKEVEIYPNPATKNITLDISGINLTENLRLCLSNIVGQKVKEFTINANATSIDLGDLTSGIYLYQLKGTNEIFKTDKIVLGAK